VRSMRARLNRLLGTALLRSTREHDAFLSGFMKASPRHRELVDELARRIGSRALDRLLPAVAPTAAPELPSDLAMASTADLRAALAIALPAWSCDSAVPLPAGTGTTVTFTSPACLISRPGGGLWFVREVTFHVVDGYTDPAAESDDGADDEADDCD